jgi:hypothetical protein
MENESFGNLLDKVHSTKAIAPFGLPLIGRLQDFSVLNKKSDSVNTEVMTMERDLIQK